MHVLEEAFNLTPELLLVGGVRYEYIELDRSVADPSAGMFIRLAAPEPV